MTTPRSSLLLPVLALLLAPALTACAQSTQRLADGPTAKGGVVFEVETTYFPRSGQAQDRQVSVYEIKTDGFHIHMNPVVNERGKSGVAHIYDGESDQMMVIDHADKSYFVEHVGPLKGVIAVKKTKERATKQGYHCVRYEVFRDASLVGELWVTDWETVGGGDDAAKMFSRVSGLWYHDHRLDYIDFHLAWLTLTEKGLPVEVSLSAEDGGVIYESRLANIRSEQIAPAAFEPPPGYKRVSSGRR